MSSTYLRDRRDVAGTESSCFTGQQGEAEADGNEPATPRRSKKCHDVVSQRTESSDIRSRNLLVEV
jgi:hypothetical protein